MSTAPLLIRYLQPGAGARLGILLDDTVFDISHAFPQMADFFRSSCGSVDDAIAALINAAD